MKYSTLGECFVCFWIFVCLFVFVRKRTKGVLKIKNIWESSSITRHIWRKWGQLETGWHLPCSSGHHTHTYRRAINVHHTQRTTVTMHMMTPRSMPFFPPTLYTQCNTYTAFMSLLPTLHSCILFLTVRTLLQHHSYFRQHHTCSPLKPRHFIHMHRFWGAITRKCLSPITFTSGKLLLIGR